jgi:hypothetical protein
MLDEFELEVSAFCELDGVSVYREVERKDKEDPVSCGEWLEEILSASRSNTRNTEVPNARMKVPL